MEMAGCTSWSILSIVDYVFNTLKHQLCAFTFYRQTTKLQEGIVFSHVSMGDDRPMILLPLPLYNPGPGAPPLAMFKLDPLGTPLYRKGQTHSNLFIMKNRLLGMRLES